jgi:dihydroflavonol-4-reductase
VTRALVTGATGFTGTHLVNRLVEAGCDVRVIARDADRARAALPDGVDIVHGDITDPSVAPRAVRDVDVVYHLAAAFREPGIPDSRYHEVHVDATRYLLEASRAEGIRRFVHCSTIGVHSHIADPPADENYPMEPDDIYQRTKADGELLAREFQREHDFPLTVIRPAGIYGPGDLRLLKLFKGVARRRFPIIGDGEVFFHMVHVNDLTDGMMLAAENPSAVGEVFIIAGEEYCTLNELVAKIAAIYDVEPLGFKIPVGPVFAAAAVCEAVCRPLGIEPPLYRRRVAFFTKSRAFNIDKAKQMLGFHPAVSLEEGLRTTAEWYREKGLL